MKNILFIAFLLSNLNMLFAQTTQPDTNLYLFKKNDGSEYIGKLLSDDGREILILTEKLGKIFIPKSEINSIVVIKDKNSIVRGEFHSEGPFTTRHSFTTNALPIKKGENYAMVNLYGPEVHFAVTDHFNIGIMSTWIASPVAIAAKYTFPSNNPKVNFSIGTLMGTSGYLDNFSSLGGLHFGNLTYGDRKNNITFSAGYGYLLNAWDDPYEGPIISIAGIAKVGAKASFIFDSMFGSFKYGPDYTTNAFVIMPGMRFQTKENRALQVSLAGVATIETGDFVSFPLPMVSWFYKF